MTSCYEKTILEVTRSEDDPTKWMVDSVNDVANELIDQENFEESYFGLIARHGYFTGAAIGNAVQDLAINFRIALQSGAISRCKLDWLRYDYRQASKEMVKNAGRLACRLEFDETDKATGLIIVRNRLGKKSTEYSLYE